MTRQVRDGYRKHKKRSWVFALFSALAAAAILIPLASGGGAKTYTLSVSPTSFCAGAANSSTVTMTNTARTQTLGSAELFFPAGSVSSVSLGGTNVSVASNVSGSPYLSGTWDTIGPLNNLNLAFGQSVNLTVTYNGGTYSGPIESVVKQANQFNDTSGGANLFANPATWPQLSIATCQYVFTQQPTNAQTGKPQTVKVQLQSGTTAVPVSGPLTLTVQNGTPTGSFTGLTSSAQDATNTWVFSSVTGNQSGTGYQLVAGSTQSNSFGIYDCLVTNGSCSSNPIPAADGTSGGQFSGTGLVGTGVNLTFSGLPSTGAAACQNGWGWSEMTYPYPNGTNTFDGLNLSDFALQPGTGYMLATLYIRNDLYVQTNASQTNNIQLCAGVKHTGQLNDGSNPWMGAGGTAAIFDPATGLYWGVLQRIPNCNKNKIPVNNGVMSPALCAWGTLTNPFGDGYDYRTATVIVPNDWDISFKG